MRKRGFFYHFINGNPVIRLLKKAGLTLIVSFATCMSYGHGHGNFIHSDLLSSIQPGDKAAVLMVHFGTTHADTKAKTIDALNALVRNEFPELDFYEAWTSRIVIRRVREKGIEISNPLEALQNLHTKGYTHVIIQSSNIIEGIEMESLRKDVAVLEGKFKDIRIGNPLLYTPEDYEAVIEVLTAHYESEPKDIVMVGHGTYTPATAQYAMLDYMFKRKGYERFHVSTIEGYPTMEDLREQLYKYSVTSVCLVPFLFVAGEHAKNDIAVDWKEELEESGLNVSVNMEGLGEIPGIRDIYVNHIRFMMKHKLADITDKKKNYAAGADREEH